MNNKITYISYCLCLASNFLYNLDSFNKKSNNNYSQHDLNKETVNSVIDATIKDSYDKEFLKTLNNLIG